MRQHEQWSATQEPLEHQAQSESSILDLAQARFAAEANIAGAMSDAQLANIISDQLDDRNSQILSGELDGKTTLAAQNELRENNLLIDTIHHQADFQLDDTLEDSTRFSQDLSQAFHRVDFDNDSVKSEAATLVAANIFGDLYMKSIEEQLYDTNCTEIKIGPDDFILTDPQQFADALLQDDTSEMTTVLERAKLVAGDSEYPLHPESLDEYAQITENPETIMALSIQKTSKKMLNLKEFLGDMGHPVNSPVMSALNSTGDLTDNLKAVSINDRDDARFQQSDHIQQRMFDQIADGANAGFVDTSKIEAFSKPNYYPQDPYVDGLQTFYQNAMRDRPRESQIPTWTWTP